MAKKVKEKKARDPRSIPLAQPDRSGPSEATLLQLAQERGLFKQADEDPRNKHKTKGKGLPEGAVRIDRPKRDDGSDEEDDDDEEEEEEDDDDDTLLSPFMDRIMDSLLWTVSLAIVHGTLDVLVQNQYAIEISWSSVFSRTLLAFVGKWRPLRISDTAMCSLRLTAGANASSPLLPLPQPPRAPLQPDPRPGAAAPLPEPPPAGHLLRDRRHGRLLPDIHHKQVQLPVHPEAGADAGVPVDLVRPRDGPGRGRRQSGCCGGVFIARGIRHQMMGRSRAGGGKEKRAFRFLLIYCNRDTGTAVTGEM